MDLTSFFIGGLFALLFGLALGSFANVLVIRIKDASSVLGRSRCPSCGTAIKPRHLVPVLSWFILRGKCASCHKSIHIQYPIVEAIGVLLVLVAYLRHPFFMQPQEIGSFLFESLFAVDLLVLTAFDFRWKLLPLEFIAGSGLVFAAWGLLDGRLSFLSCLYGLLVGAGFLGVQVLVSRGKWLGSGDPWMGGMLGMVLGWPLIGVSYYFTYIIGGIMAVVLLVTGHAKRGTRVPFGPLLACGALLALWFGPLVVRLVAEAWYGRV